MSKLLFIQYRPAGKVMNGGDQCTKRNYDMLCRTLGEEEVDVYYMHREENKSSFYAYLVGAMYMLFGYFFGLNPGRLKQLVVKAQAYEYVFIDRSVYGVLAKALKENGYKGKIITHFHNVEKSYFEDKMPKHLPFRNVLIRCVDKNDAMACHYSDATIVLNNRDAESLKILYNATKQTVIPISLPDRASDIADQGEKTCPRLRCLFLGSYFAPNNEGIIWFMRHVAPQVDVDIRIVGKGMNKLKSEQSDLLKDVEVISDAPDLVPYLQRADVMILPIFSGSGMKVKTCESLMYGKNIIGTDEAFEGYSIQEGLSGWRCNTKEEFVNCITDFAQFPRPRFNMNARKLYCERYSTDAVMNKIRTLLA